MCCNFRETVIQLKMSILSYNGGAVLAMSGDNCVAIASDLRLGRELITIATDFPKVSQID